MTDVKAARSGRMVRAEHFRNGEQPRNIPPVNNTHNHNHNPGTKGPAGSRPPVVNPEDSSAT